MMVYVTEKLFTKRKIIFIYSSQKSSGGKKSIKLWDTIISCRIFQKLSTIYIGNNVL